MVYELEINNSANQNFQIIVKIIEKIKNVRNIYNLFK